MVGSSIRGKKILGFWTNDQRPTTNFNREDRIANPVNRFTKEKKIWHDTPMQYAVSAAARE